MHNDLIFGTLVLLGFFALLRTGELFLVKPCNVLMSEQRVIISLEQTKTGKRGAATEIVSFEGSSQFWHWNKHLYFEIVNN